MKFLRVTIYCTQSEPLFPLKAAHSEASLVDSLAELLYHEALLSGLKEIVLQGRISHYIFFALTVTRSECLRARLCLV